MATAGIQPEVEAAVRGAIAELQSLGAEVRPVSLPHTRYALPVYYLIAPAEASANLARFEGVRFGPRAEAPAPAGQGRATFLNALRQIPGRDSRRGNVFSLALIP